MEFSLHFRRDAYIPEYCSSGTAVDGFLKSVVWGFHGKFHGRTLAMHEETG